MAREIKFRAWFKREIEIGKPLRFDMVIDEDEGEMVFQMVSDKEIRYPPIVIFGDPDEWIVEQFTGLKDKNGIEVYEGDIVKVYAGGKPRGKYTIQYLGRSFVMAGEYDESELDCVWWVDFEIIGNIHEHPRLIKAKA